MTEEDDQVERAKAILAEHGFKLEVGGCGCCGSPWVRLAHDGSDVVFETRDGRTFARDNVCIDMFGDE